MHTAKFNRFMLLTMGPRVRTVVSYKCWKIMNRTLCQLSEDKATSVSDKDPSLNQYEVEGVALKEFIQIN